METEIKAGSLPGAIRDEQWRLVGPFTLSERIVIEMGLLGAMRHYDDECWSISRRAPTADEGEDADEGHGPADWTFRAVHEPGQFALYARDEQDLAAQIGWWYAGELVTVYEGGERRTISRYRQYYRALECFLRNENHFGQYLVVAYLDSSHGISSRVVLSEGDGQGPRIGIGVGDGQGAPARPGEVSLPLPMLRPEEYRQLQDGVLPSRLPRYHLLCARLRRELEAALEARQEARDGDRG